MKKKVFGAKLSRERASRSALFVSLVEALILQGSVKTTKAKAKAIVPMVDKLVVLAKKDTLASKRQILKKLRGNSKVASILWVEVSKVFSNRRSGFTRIIPLNQRKGDLAKMVKLEWVEKVELKGREKDSKNKKEDKKDKSSTKEKKADKKGKTDKKK